MKASGSFFHELAPDERQTWQDAVDGAYDLFLTVISTSRPGLTIEDLRDKTVIDRRIVERDEKGNPKLDKQTGKELTAQYTRRLADGGTYTAADAKRFGLIDEIEDLPAVVRSAATAAGITRFKAVTYARRLGLVERLTGLPVQFLSEVE
jgi:ClpP class serine protease